MKQIYQNFLKEHNGDHDIAGLEFIRHLQEKGIEIPTNKLEVILKFPLKVQKMIEEHPSFLDEIFAKPNIFEAYRHAIVKYGAKNRFEEQDLLDPNFQDRSNVFEKFLKQQDPQNPEYFYNSLTDYLSFLKANQFLVENNSLLGNLLPGKYFPKFEASRLIPYYSVFKMVEKRCKDWGEVEGGKPVHGKIALYRENGKWKRLEHLSPLYLQIKEKLGISDGLCTKCCDTLFEQ